MPTYVVRTFETPHTHSVYFGSYSSSGIVGEESHDFRKIMTRHASIVRAAALLRPPEPVNGSNPSFLPRAP